MGYYGNVNELEDIGRSPEKSYLFFLTVQHLGSRLPGEEVYGLGKHHFFEVFGALLTIRENSRERFIIIAGRTHNRSRSPRCTASSQ